MICGYFSSISVTFWIFFLLDFVFNLELGMKLVRSSSPSSWVSRGWSDVLSRLWMLTRLWSLTKQSLAGVPQSPPHLRHTRLQPRPPSSEPQQPCLGEHPWTPCEKNMWNNQKCLKKYQSGPGPSPPHSGSLHSSSTSGSSLIMTGLLAFTLVKVVV